MNDSLNPLKRSRFTHPGAFAGYCGTIRIVSLAVLALIGWLDYVTGYEFGFFIFYFIPVAIAAWYCGRRSGVEIAFASAIVWYLSDKYTFHPYSNAYFIYWKVFMRLLSFLTTALTLARIREMVLNEERLLKELLETRQELDMTRENLTLAADTSQLHGNVGSSTGQGQQV
jgi:K+-sensing histidine kinase KdpD